jgi:serine/threonine-protein kinase
MTDFFKWLSSNPIATNAFTIAVSVIVISIVLIYVVAFFQGRSISFWPPNIGERPGKLKEQNEDLRSTTKSNKSDDPNFAPVVQRGMSLTTATGNKVIIGSNFYGGANATLYRAKYLNGDEVIVKLFWRGLMPGSPPFELFRQEQRAAEILVHRNIVTNLDRGLHGGYPFIVMEYFGGGTLRDWLRSHDRIPGQYILAIAGQVASAIDFAHSKGVVHRDIKPGNILFESDPHGRVALGDFGIARIFGAVQRDITAIPAMGEFAGSPGYLAPEAFSGHEITKASDIYGFGVVLYEMIAGKIPFDEVQEVYAILQVKITQDAPDIRHYRKDVSEDVAIRLATTLSRNPSKRPQTAREVLTGIEQSIERL